MHQRLARQIAAQLRHGGLTPQGRSEQAAFHGVQVRQGAMSEFVPTGLEGVCHPPTPPLRPAGT